MRIPAYESINQLGRVESAVRESREVTGGPSGRRQPSTNLSLTGVDTVELSSRAREVGRIQQVVAEAPEMRDARVTEAKQALATGTLHLNGQTLADKLLLDLQYSTGMRA